MQNKREQIFELLDHLYGVEEPSEREQLGFQALEMVEDTLAENPGDWVIREIRIRLNYDLKLDNTSQMLEDAEFMAYQGENVEERNTGYRWLCWIYGEKLGMEEKTFELLQEQYAYVPQNYKKHYEIKAEKARILNEMSISKRMMGQLEEATDLALQSFDEFHFIYDRNGLLGNDLLERGQFEKATEVLYTHFLWSNMYQDSFRITYAKTIEKLYRDGALDNYPELIALFFHIVRNEKEAFSLTKRSDFLNKYQQELESLLQKYPDSYNLWCVMGNSYYFDQNNYSKALTCFEKMLQKNQRFGAAYHERILDCCEQTGNDFFTLPFKNDYGDPQVLYNIFTTFYNLWLKKREICFLKLAEPIAKHSYNTFRAYLIDEQGSEYHNQPHIFAMACNNYGLVLGDLLENDPNGAWEDTLPQIGVIHFDGYQVSPFFENIQNASFMAQKTYLTSNDPQLKNAALHELLRYAQIWLDDYGSESTVEDLMGIYYYLMFSYRRLDKPEEATLLYEKAKNEYLEFEDHSKNITKWFRVTAIDYYILMVETQQQFDAMLGELNWFLCQPQFKESENRDIGRACYLKALCLNNIGKEEEVLPLLERAIPLLSNAAEGYLEEYLDRAKKLMYKLRGIPDFEKELAKLFEGNWKETTQQTIVTGREEDKVAFLEEFIDTFSNPSQETVTFWTDENRCFEIFRNKINNGDLYHYVRFYFLDEKRTYEYFLNFENRKSGGFFSKRENKIIKTFTSETTDFTGEKNNSSLLSSVHTAAELLQKGNALWNELFNRFLTYKSKIKK